MPIIKSAKKRVRVAHNATDRNAKTKRTLKLALKSFQKSLDSDRKNAADLLRSAQSNLGVASKKHVMHKNKVARKQRQLAKAAKAAGISLTTPKKATTTTKKPTTKKPAAKKPVAKKTAKKT